MRALIIGLSLAAKARIQRVETAAQRSVTFRRLLAETYTVPRRAGILEEGACVLYEPPPADRLVFDETAMAKVSDEELELSEARELARASMGPAAPVREAELAAVQRQARVVLELAAGEPAFAKRMAALAAHPPAPPRDEEGRAALAAALLAGSPDRLDTFGGVVVPGLDHAARLASLADPHRPAAFDRAREAIGEREEDAKDLSKKLKNRLR